MPVQALYVGWCMDNGVQSVGYGTMILLIVAAAFLVVFGVSALLEWCTTV